MILLGTDWYQLIPTRTAQYMGGSRSKVCERAQTIIHLIQDAQYRMVTVVPKVIPSVMVLSEKEYGATTYGSPSLVFLVTNTQNSTTS